MFSNSAHTWFILNFRSFINHCKATATSLKYLNVFMSSMFSIHGLNLVILLVVYVFGDNRTTSNTTFCKPPVKKEERKTVYSAPTDAH